MLVNRRGVFARLLAGLAAGVTGSRAMAAGAEGKAKVAYHLSDVDRINFVLGNIENHIAGEGGPEKVDIVLVVNGPALGAFRTTRADAEVGRRLASVAGKGVHLGACGNTLDAQKITVADLLPGFFRVDEGGVVRLARLQAEGYAYLRP
jgi:intracellular sulfur oxidation DsrE/DsrF family protein